MIIAEERVGIVTSLDKSKSLISISSVLSTWEMKGNTDWEIRAHFVAWLDFYANDNLIGLVFRALALVDCPPYQYIWTVSMIEIVD